MQITKSRENDTLTIAVDGRVDSPSAVEFEKCVSESIDGVKRLIFDFKELTYISSAGLRVILMAHKKMSRQGSMKLINVNDNIMDILRLTGFSDLYVIE